VGRERVPPSEARPSDPPDADTDLSPPIFTRQCERARKDRHRTVVTGPPDVPD
jgi:hypothetical protein